jgi:signal transduction histidine kinase
MKPPPDEATTLMGTLRHRKQIFLFLAAVLIPSLTLVLFTRQLVRQEKELSAKRIADEREHRAQEIGRDLLLRLERLKIEEARSEETLLTRPAEYRPGRPEIVILGLVEEGRLFLPWEQPPSATQKAAAGDARTAANIRAGEKAEFERKDFVLAAEMYRRALAAGRGDGDYARLLLARVLVKSGNTAEAFRHYETLLALPAGRKDEDGIPLFLYAADRLANSPRYFGPLAARVGDDLRAMRWMSPQEAALVDSILSRVGEKAVSDEVKRTASGLLDLLRPYSAKAERLTALQKGFAGYSFRLGGEGSMPSPGSTWEVEPKGECLLGLGELRPGRQALLVVDIGELNGALKRDRDFRQVYPEEILLTSAERRPGESLGPKLKGLNVVFPGSSASSTTIGSASTRPFYTLAMGAVVMFASLGGYLLWRDVQRELGLAELRSQFASSVSHELKTPLTAIRMFAETIRMGRIGSEETRNEYLDTIVNESERLSRLLNNVLDVSKIEQGKKIYRPSLQSLAPIVRTAARTMEYPLRQKGFTLRVDIEEGLPDVRVDADALEQALLNLIGNAIKYSGEAREIGLGLARRDSWAVVRVSDRGVGIPPRDRQRIFEKFYRVPSRENEEIPGTGLGLSLVAHFVQAHKGRVEVAGDPGQGSTFSLFLPIEEVP